MNKTKKEEMDLQQISKDIVAEVNFRQNFIDSTFESVSEMVEKMIQEKVVNILEPESVYEKGKHYENLGNYVGIVDTYPHGTDYYVRNHHFSVISEVDKVAGGNVAKINKVKIREIKK